MTPNVELTRYLPLVTTRSSSSCSTPERSRGLETSGTVCLHPSVPRPEKRSPARVIHLGGMLCGPQGIEWPDAMHEPWVEHREPRAGYVIRHPSSWALDQDPAGHAVRLRWEGLPLARVRIVHEQAASRLISRLEKETVCEVRFGGSLTSLLKSVVYEGPYGYFALVCTTPHRNEALSLELITRGHRLSLTQLRLLESLELL